MNKQLHNWPSPSPRPSCMQYLLSASLPVVGHSPGNPHEPCWLLAI
jgi:hypothetical protein